MARRIPAKSAARPTATSAVKRKTTSKTSRRDGSTPAKAILQDQWVWQRRHCPHHRVVLQALGSEDGKYFDRLTLVSDETGDTRVLYFALPYLDKPAPPKKPKGRA